MKRFLVLLVALIIGTMCFAQTDTEIETESSSDPYAFQIFTVTKDHAQIDMAYNELTGVLRATYTLKDFKFDKADATTAIRDAVNTFAKERGYFKLRLYPEEDEMYYSDETRVAKFKRFYILYDRSKVITK